MQGSLSQIIAVRSGQHKIHVKIEPGDGAAQEDRIKGAFSSKPDETCSFPLTTVRCR
jgi:hypothetical protein